MATAATIKTLGDFGNKIEVPLKDALSAGMDVMQVSAEKITRTYLAFMADSAAKMTPISELSRRVFPNPQFRHLMKKSQYKTQRQLNKTMAHYFKRAAWRLYQPPKNPKQLFANKDKVIGSLQKLRGIAARSWKWGLKDAGLPATSRAPIPGSYDLYTIYGGKDSGPYASMHIKTGFVLVNKISYISKIMPPGWEQDVETKARNRVLGMVRQRLQTEVATAMVKGWARSA